MLVELHSLTSHAPANLNRDDLGRPKAATFGGTQRSRISSQSIKRSIRTSNYLAETMDHGISTRSRRIPERIFNSLQEEIGTERADELKKLCAAVTELLGKPDPKNALHTRQIIFMTQGEIERVKAYLRNVLEETKKVDDKVIKSFKENAVGEIGLDRSPGDGVDLALFGRMTTDKEDAFASVDAAMQVAHAISTHTVIPEVDWYTAVDDVVRDSDETGTAHLGETEFNAAVYYKYFSCNLPLLVQNLGNNRSIAIDSLAAVLDAACQVTPSGKQNSFASHALADTVLLVLRKKRIPASLANAFERPVPASDDGYLGTSRTRLAEHYKQLATGYDLEDTAILYAVSAEERDRLAALLPNTVHIASSLAEVFDLMRKHSMEMLERAEAEAMEQVGGKVTS